MALALRFVAVWSAVLFACAAASAQPPAAPEPHLALDGLVKEYKRLGLPLSPPNAELVRVKLTPDGRWQYGFRTPPAKPGETPGYLIGVKNVDSVAVVELLKLDRTASGVDEWVKTSDLLCLTAQCHARGWKEFAEALYARVLAEISGTRTEIVTKLWPKSYELWRPRIWEWNYDRKEVLRYLKEAIPEGNPDIRDLELTVAPTKSKPGTAEFFIDGLTEYSRWPDGWLRPRGYPAGDWESGEEQYLKLAELGFDAVPVLIEHLGDRRFTWRHEPPRYYVSPSYPIRVGHIVGQLLDDLSNGWTGYRMDGEKVGDPKKAREWLAEARKVGEEMWLAERVLPAMQYVGKDQDLVEGGGVPNKAIARALGARYPARLGEAYQTVLYKRQPVESEVLARAIVLSKLPREKKLALLEEGLAHKESAHRSAALDALADLDAPAFHKRLIAMLKADADEDLAGFVCRTDDPACWDALAANALRGTVGYQQAILREMSMITTPDQSKKTRRERIRFLAGFLSDPSAGGEGNHPQDIAARMLAGEVGLALDWSTRRGPFSRTFIRAAVAKAAAEELERLKK